MTKFPKDLDTWRPYVEDFDEMIAEDLTELFDAVVAIENELGANPSGKLGTVYSRLFATKNISETDGFWSRMSYVGAAALGNGADFDRSKAKTFFSLNKGRYSGPSDETEFGESVPAVFGNLRKPLVSAGSSPNLLAPWRSCLWRLDTPDNDSSTFAAGWVAMTGDGKECAAQAMENVEFDVLLWNAFT